MVCCHTDESMFMAVVRCVVYWVTCVYAGGYVVSMACWRAWSPSDSVCSPHMQCVRSLLVIVVPLLFLSLQLSGRVATIRVNEVCPASRASIMRGMRHMLGGVRAVGCNGVGVEGPCV